MTLAVILQPTYLPWIGFFGQIEVADVFVFYDDVQFVHRSYQRRNRVRTPQGWTYLSVPVETTLGETIAQVRINNDIAWREEHRQSIDRLYRQASSYENHEGLLDDLYGNRHSSLGEMTIAQAKRTAEELGISADYVASSALRPAGAKTARLIDTLKKVDADAYLTGPAARDYVEPERFKEAGIDLFWFVFDHPVYEQRFPGFEPYMACIDMILNVGVTVARRRIREASQRAITRTLPPKSEA